MSPYVRFDDLPFARRFPLLSWTVTPRPIAWVTTVSNQGVRNLAPFSFFTVASSDPLILMLAIEPNDEQGRKDTLNNITDSGEFVIHIAPDDRVNEVARSAENSEPTFDEIADLGLPTLEATSVTPPLLDGSIAAYECTLLSTQRPGRETLVFGQVEVAHIARHLLGPDGRIATDELQPLGRIGSIFAVLQHITAQPLTRPPS